jgi:SH3-like domain-containing protein
LVVEFIGCKAGFYSTLFLKEEEFQMQPVRFICAGFALMAVLALPMAAVAQKTLSVQVREGQLRATPSFLGKVVAKVAYGDRVDMLEDRDAWKRVSLQGGKLRGWMHASALTAKQVVLKAGQADVRTSATRDELALAGKGFNEQVEAAFKKENKNLDYTWLNRMEGFKISPEQMQSFLDKGSLAPPAEGGKR